MPGLLKTLPNIDVYQLSTHAYAAIGSNPQPMSNAGWVDLGGLCVVFDTFLSVEAALEMKQAALDLTGYEDFVVVNSHGHLDHTLGNGVFAPGTPIIASPATREAMMKSLQEVHFGTPEVSERVQELETRLAVAVSETERLDIENELIFYRNLVDPRGRIALPNMVIGGSFAIYGETGQFDLRLIEVAHSPGDVVGYLAAEKVAFVGDLIFAGEHPWIGSGNPQALRAELVTLLESGCEVFVPGHGPLCGRAQVQDQIEYLDAIQALVRDHRDKPEEIRPDGLPAKFHAYEGPCFQWNVDFLLKQHKPQP